MHWSHRFALHLASKYIAPAVALTITETEVMATACTHTKLKDGNV